MLFDLVDTLPADQRRVIVGRFVEQRSICEMAGEMDRTEGAIKQLQLRALKSLRELAGRGQCLSALLADFLRLDALIAEMLLAPSAPPVKDRRLAPLAQLAADLRDLPRPAF